MPDCVSCGQGPWIKLSHCGIFGYDQATNALLSVRCPSRFCPDKLVPLVNGRIALHTAPIDEIVPGGCPWVGTRIVDDRADYEAAHSGRVQPGWDWS